VRVLFLDIDGVLNSRDWMTRRVRSPLFGRLPDWQKMAEDCIDPDAVERLNRIVEETGCVVVLSSTWRKSEPLPLMTRMLRYRGFRHEVWAATPDVARERRVEIQHWLDQAGLTADCCAIVDDDHDADILGRFVQTDWERGLTDDDADALIGLLR
jgi:hypothetical protein